MCGIYGIYQPGHNVAKLTYFALYALQHRGQESAGIAVVNDKGAIDVHKSMGLVSQVFKSENIEKLKGNVALGHTRYSTTGSSHLANVQPILNNLKGTPFALVHNGNLVNVTELRDALEKEGYDFESTTDSEIIGALISRSNAPTIEDALEEVTQKIKGGYSLIIITEDKLIGLRDPYGNRPLIIGQLPEGYIISSEDCAIDVLGGSTLRDVMPGEYVVIEKGQLKSVQFKNEERQAVCSFEYIYFARPDSSIDGKNLHLARVKMGRNLYQEHPVEADMVVGVPYSGIPAAIGFSKESGIPYDETLIKNRYIGRTFIQPDQELREIGVRLKLNPIAEAIKGKSIVLVDDSIVRGTTSRKIVKLLKEAGAKEVHMRVSSPPVMGPCFYGIDTSTQKELIAANFSVDEIARHLGVNSLGYLSIEGLLNAIHLPKHHMCLACFNCDYPIPIPANVKREKFLYETKPQ